MALTILTGSAQAGAINYTYRTSGSADWSSVPTGSVFYDQIDQQVRYRDYQGNIQQVYAFPFTGSAIISGSLIVTGSINGTISSASFASTASYVESASFSTTSSYATNALSASYTLTSSHATSVSTLNQNVIVSGSLTLTQNLTVLGSSSITYVTSSQLDISTNIIKVNTNTPAVRFGGLAVVDSGSSPQVSGSLLFDSQNNQWIFIHQNTASGAITSSVLLMGPQTFNNVGNETTITTNRLTKGAGTDLGEHLTSSNITDTGTLVSINSATQVTGSFLVSGSTTITGSLSLSGGVTGSLQGTASWAQNALTASFVQNAVSASYVLNAVSSSFASTSISSSNALTASYVINAQTASYVLNAVSSSFATTTLNANTASYVVTAQTASYVLNAVSASFSTSASRAISASRADSAATASYVLNAVSSSFATNAITASYVLNAQTASYVLNAVSSSFASTASFVANAFVQGGNSFGTAAILGTNDTQNLNIETNGSTRIFVSSSGQVGIGTTTPREQLGIAGGGMRIETSAGSEASTIRQTSFHSVLYMASNLYYSGSTAPESNSYYILDSGSNNRGGNLFYIKTNGANSSGFYFYTAPTSSGANTLATLTEQFRITPGTASFTNNNVGIGTTTPNAKLQVAGNITATSVTASLQGTASWAENAVTASFITLAQTASYVLNAVSSSFSSTSSFLLANTNAFIQGGNSFGSNVSLGTNDSFNLVLRTAATSRLFISSSGDIGIGTTTPLTKLHVVGDITATNFVGNLTGTATTASYVTTAQTASYVLNAVSASFATSSSRAVSSSRADSALSASFATTSSYVLNAVSSSFATTTNTASSILAVRSTTNADFFPTFVDTNNGTALAESIFTGTGFTYNPSTSTLNVSYITSSLFGTSSFSVSSSRAISASRADSSLSSSFASTASYVNTLNQTVLINGNLTVNTGNASFNESVFIGGTEHYPVSSITTTDATPTAIWSASVTTGEVVSLRALVTGKTGSAAGGIGVGGEIVATSRRIPVSGVTIIGQSSSSFENFGTGDPTFQFSGSLPATGLIYLYVTGIANTTIDWKASVSSLSVGK